MKKLIITIVTLFLMGGSAWGQIKLGQDIDGEAVGDESGYAISFSADGSRLAIGARYNDGNGNRSGHVRVYEWKGRAWIQMGADIDGQTGSDRSGVAVSLSADGSWLAIGAQYNAGNGIGAGHVRVYEWQSGAWTQIGSDMDGEAAGDESGVAVSLRRWQEACDWGT